MNYARHEYVNIFKHFVSTVGLIACQSGLSTCKICNIIVVAKLLYCVCYLEMNTRDDNLNFNGAQFPRLLSIPFAINV